MDDIDITPEVDVLHLINSLNIKGYVKLDSIVEIQDKLSGTISVHFNIFKQQKLWI